MLRYTQALDEPAFAKTHDFIIRDERAKFGPVDGYAIVKLRTLTGELQQARREHPTIFKGPIASPLGFSDVIAPGTRRAVAGRGWFSAASRRSFFFSLSFFLTGCAFCRTIFHLPPPLFIVGFLRNDFYLRLGRSELERGKKTTQRNVEVEVSLVHNVSGQVVSLLPSPCGTAQTDAILAKSWPFIMVNRHRVVCAPAAALLYLPCPSFFCPQRARLAADSLSRPHSLHPASSTRM